MPVRRSQQPPEFRHTGSPFSVHRELEEVLRVLKKLVLAAVAAGALAAVRKRSSGKVEDDLWHEATRGSGAVSTPTAP